MITAHPSPQLTATAQYMLAWLMLAVLLVLLAQYSGKTAVGVALAVFLTGLLMVYLRASGTGPRP